jgi:hypothetical protein
MVNEYGAVPNAFEFRTPGGMHIDRVQAQVALAMDENYNIESIHL